MTYRSCYRLILGYYDAETANYGEAIRQIASTSLDVDV